MYFLICDFTIVETEKTYFLSPSSSIHDSAFELIYFIKSENFIDTKM